MLRLTLCLGLLSLVLTTYGQMGPAPFPYYDDSKPPDAYMLEVDARVGELNKRMNARREELGFDTLRVQLAYALEDGNSTVLQNPYSINDPYKILEWQDSAAVLLVTSLAGEVVRIRVHNMLLYFDQNQLIYATHWCSDREAFIGSCGGTESTYRNFFKEGHYYSSLIDGKTHYCGCGANYLIPSAQWRNWITRLQARWAED